MYFLTGQSYLFTLYLKDSIIYFNVTIIFTSTSKVCGRFALRVDLPQVPTTNNTLQHRLVMHQSIETTAPRPPGHSGEFNIYPVLKDGLFPRPQGQETC